MHLIPPARAHPCYRCIKQQEVGSRLHLWFQQGLKNRRFKTVIKIADLWLLLIYVDVCFLVRVNHGIEQMWKISALIINFFLGTAQHPARQHCTISPPAFSQLSHHMDGCLHEHLFIYINQCTKSLHQLEQTFASAFLQPAECVCVFLIGREELSLWDHWDFDVRFACTNPCARKDGGRLQWGMGGRRVTRLMTFTHSARQAMRRRIRFERRRRSLFFL